MRTIIILRMALLALLFPGVSVARSQGSPEKFLIRIGNGIATGTEEFKIEKSDAGYRLTGTARFTQSGQLAVMTQEQVLAADWSPVSYRLEVEALGQKQGIEASKEGDQIQMRAALGAMSGNNSVPVRPPTVILDNMVVNHFQVLLNAIASDKEGKPEWRCLVPQVLLAIEGKLLGTQNESGTLNEFRFIPSVNHLFMEVSGTPMSGTPTGAEYGLAGKVSKEVIDAIVGWIRR